MVLKAVLICIIKSISHARYTALFIILVKILTVYSLELEDGDSPVKLALPVKQPLFNIEINVWCIHSTDSNGKTDLPLMPLNHLAIVSPRVDWESCKIWSI